MAINTISVTPEQAATIIDLVHGSNISVMLWGPPGAGKSTIVADVAKRRGARLIDERLSQKIASDLGGLPMIDTNTQTTVFARPGWFPTDPDERSILFLDELSGADEHTRIAAYGLILERRIGAWSLPKNCQVIAASNRPEDGAISADLGSALNDRMLHLIVEPKLSDWIGWAADNDIHPAVVAFLKSSPHRLMPTDQQKEQGDAIVPSPRSWARASDLMRRLDRPGVSARIRAAAISGLLGDQVANDFFAVYDEVYALTPIADIIEAARNNHSELFKLLPETANGLFALGFGLASVLDSKTIEPAMRVVLAVPEIRAALASGEAMAFVGTMVCETIERRQLFDAALLSPSFDRYSRAMNEIRDAA